MGFSNFVKKKSNRIAIYAFFLNVALLFILIITLIVPIQDDPPIYHYPYMVYLPYSLSINFLLFIIAGINLRQNEGKFKNVSDNWNFMLMMYEKIQWKNSFSLWERVIRNLCAILLFGAFIAFFLIGFVAPPYFFSPMNMFFLPFVFCLLSVWISYGLKRENNNVALWLFILLLLFIVLFISALIIAQDMMIMFITISYQIIALILLLIRIIIYGFYERKK